MSGHWSVRSGGVKCGYDGGTVLAGAPVYVMTGAIPRYRCVTHAPRPLDEAQVAKARWELEAARVQKFHKVLTDAGLEGVQTASGPKPFAAVADNPVVRKATQDGER